MSFLLCTANHRSCVAHPHQWEGNPVGQGAASAHSGVQCVAWDGMVSVCWQHLWHLRGQCGCVQLHEPHTALQRAPGFISRHGCGRFSLGSLRKRLKTTSSPHGKGWVISLLIPSFEREGGREVVVGELVSCSAYLLLYQKESLWLVQDRAVTAAVVWDFSCFLPRLLLKYSVEARAAECYLVEAKASSACAQRPGLKGTVRRRFCSQECA